MCKLIVYSQWIDFPKFLCLGLLVEQIPNFQPEQPIQRYLPKQFQKLPLCVKRVASLTQSDHQIMVVFTIPKNRLQELVIPTCIQKDEDFREDLS